jgi:hypothetical protein
MKAAAWISFSRAMLRGHRCLMVLRMSGFLFQPAERFGFDLATANKSTHCPVLKGHGFIRAA